MQIVNRQVNGVAFLSAVCHSGFGEGILRDLGVWDHSESCRKSMSVSLCPFSERVSFLLGRGTWGNRYGIPAPSLCLALLNKDS